MKIELCEVVFRVVLIVGGGSALLHVESNPRLKFDYQNRYVLTSRGNDVYINCTIFYGVGILWKLPNNSDIIGFDSQNFLERVTESELKNNYSRTRELHISDAKVSDTGAYTCYEEGNEGNNIVVYVYVKDDELFLKPAISGLRVDERHFVVPCRATYPPAEGSVKLFVDDKEWVSARGKYDPRIGFALRTPDLEEKKIDQKKFRCEHENGGRKPEFIIMVDPSLSLEMAPQNEWAFVGAVNFTLTCSLKGRLESAYKHKLNVTCPRCSKQDIVTQKFGYLEKKSGMEVVVNIAEVGMADAGKYHCKWYKENSGADGFDLAKETIYELEVSSSEGQLKFEQQIPDNAIKVFEGDPIVLKAHIVAFPSIDTAEWRKYSLPLGKEGDRHYVSRDVWGEWSDHFEAPSLEDVEQMEQAEVYGGIYVGNDVRDMRRGQANIWDFDEVPTKAEARIHRAKVSDSGEYVLEAQVKGLRRSLQWHVAVINRQPVVEVRIASPDKPWVLLDQKYYKKGTVLTVECLVTGLPLATPKLYRKGAKSQPYMDVPSSELLVLEGTYERALVWNHTVDDDVLVKCDGTRDSEVVSDEKVIRMENTPHVGVEVKKSEQKTDTEDEVEGAPSSSFVGMALAIGLICLSVIWIVIIFTCCRVLKKARETERALGVLYDQLMRSVNPIDPLSDHEAKQVPIEERLNQIPYNRQFEVESNNLQIGELLGRGQFGKVCVGWLSQPARVSDSVAERKRLPVAVKMPLNGHDVQHQRMLAEELKIMTYIRPHPNVLSLVGAVTKNMKSGKLFVVVEMCDNGSLKDFLVAFKRRPGAFMDELREAPSDGYLAPNSRPKRLYAAELSDKIEPNRPDSESDRLLDEKSITLLSTSDLLSFSMQIANGMEYLSSIPCFHRDLAARNVLLTKNGLCRIADFGLARREQKDYYRMRKSRDIPMPFRWMSPEAVGNSLFSQASDVWSFGILLYEIFSLGGNPYPEWENDEVMERLRKGERNRQPQHAHDEVYSLMKQCWDFEVSQRPLFTDCLHLLKEHLKLASSELFDRVERLMSEEWTNLESYADWRGEDEPEPHNVLVDRPIQENGDTEQICVQD